MLFGRPDFFNVVHFSDASDLNKCELLEKSTEEIVANDMNWPNLAFKKKKKSHRRTNFTMKNESNQTGFLRKCG